MSMWHIIIDHMLINWLIRAWPYIIIKHTTSNIKKWNVNHLAYRFNYTELTVFNEKT